MEYPKRDCPSLVIAKQKGRGFKPPTSVFMVGVTRFELVASSVSGKRSPPELNAHALGADASHQQVDILAD